MGEIIDLISRRNLKLAEKNRDFIKRQIDSIRDEFIKHIKIRHPIRQFDSISEIIGFLKIHNKDVNEIFKEICICEEINEIIEIITLSEEEDSLQIDQDLFWEEIKSIVKQEFESVFAWIYKEPFYSNFRVENCF